MASIMSGLTGLGLDDLKDVDLFEKPQEEVVEKPVNVPKEKEKEKAKVEEKDFLYDKTITCPVCDNNFATKIVKTGKARLIKSEKYLRGIHDGIDAVKYDVQMCPNCGYAALSRYFSNVSGGQAKLILENISQKVSLHSFDGEIYTYKEAMERYQLALASAVVKRAKASEKAYICLKSAWLLQGYEEYLDENGDTTEDREALKAKEEEYLMNAYKGFLEARQSEAPPICGMDNHTLDYLMAELAFHFKIYDVSGKLVASILTSKTVNSRTKDKARELKDQILAEIKANKQ